ncbi:MAG: hypothetical protein AAF244_04785 [Pseudomonadota bacterium]
MVTQTIAQLVENISHTDFSIMVELQQAIKAKQEYHNGEVSYQDGRLMGHAFNIQNLTVPYENAAKHLAKTNTSIDDLKSHAKVFHNGQYSEHIIDEVYETLLVVAEAKRQYNEIPKDTGLSAEEIAELDAELDAIKHRAFKMKHRAFKTEVLNAYQQHFDK